MLLKFRFYQSHSIHDVHVDYDSRIYSTLVCCPTDVPSDEVANFDQFHCHSVIILAL
jgi:hypothetical protein